MFFGLALADHCWVYLHRDANGIVPEDGWYWTIPNGTTVPDEGKVWRPEEPSSVDENGAIVGSQGLWMASDIYTDWEYWPICEFPVPEDYEEPALQAFHCPSANGAVMMDGACFVPYPDVNLRFAESLHFCTTRGGSLAAVPNADQLAALHAQIPTVDYWVNMRRRYDFMIGTDGWYWPLLNGSTLDVALGDGVWNPGEPDGTTTISAYLRSAIAKLSDGGHWATFSPLCQFTGAGLKRENGLDGGIGKLCKAKAHPISSVNTLSMNACIVQCLKAVDCQGVDFGFGVCRLFASALEAWVVEERDGFECLTP